MMISCPFPLRLGPFDNCLPPTPSERPVARPHSACGAPTPGRGRGQGPAPHPGVREAGRQEEARRPSHLCAQVRGGVAQLQPCLLIAIAMSPPWLLSPPSLPPTAKCTLLPLLISPPLPPLPRHSIHSPPLSLLSTHCRLPDLTMPASAAPLELVFVVDGSGSMDGSPIQQAGS